MLEWEQTRSNHLRFAYWLEHSKHVFIIETREKIWVRKAIILKRMNRKYMKIDDERMDETTLVLTGGC